MKILGNSLSESPVGKLYTTVKNLINPYASENQENINLMNKNIESRKGGSSKDKDSKGVTNDRQSPVFRRRPIRDEQRQAKHLISNINYNSSSSDESEINQQKSIRLIKGRTPIKKRNVISMTSSEEEARDSVSTVKFDDEEARSLYSKIKKSDNEVTTSSLGSSSSEEEIDISIPSQVVVKKKKKNENKSLDSFVTTTGTSDTNDFFSFEEESQKKIVESDVVINDSDEVKSDDNNHETVVEIENNEGKINEGDVEMVEPSLNQVVDENRKVDENVVEKKKNDRGECCAVLRRKKKSERLMKKRKELTPCVIIDIIRRKTHPLNKYQHLFTHKSIAKLTDKELNHLKYCVMKHYRKNVRK